MAEAQGTLIHREGVFFLVLPQTWCLNELWLLWVPSIDFPILLLSATLWKIAAAGPCSRSSPRDSSSVGWLSLSHLSKQEGFQLTSIISEPNRLLPSERASSKHYMQTIWNIHLTINFRILRLILTAFPLCSFPMAITQQEKLRQAKIRVCSLLSCVQLFVTPWTIACHAPLSMEFSRQEYWSGLPLPSFRVPSPPRDWTHFLHWQVDSLPSEPPGKSRQK